MDELSCFRPIIHSIAGLESTDQSQFGKIQLDHHSPGSSMHFSPRGFLKKTRNIFCHMYFIKFKDYRPRVARKLSVRNNTIKYTCINQNVTSDWNKTYLTKF